MYNIFKTFTEKFKDIYTNEHIWELKDSLENAIVMASYNMDATHMTPLLELNNHLTNAMLNDLKDKEKKTADYKANELKLNKELSFYENGCKETNQ